MFARTLLLAIFPGAALACMMEVTVSQDLSVYDRIYAGEVTGIHLEDYEAAKLRCDDPSDRFCFGADFTPRFVVDVVVWRSLKGDASRRETVMLGGCGVTVPSPYFLGVFYVRSDGVAVAEYFERRDEQDFREKVGSLTRLLAK